MVLRSGEELENFYCRQFSCFALVYNSTKKLPSGLQFCLLPLNNNQKHKHERLVLKAVKMGNGKNFFDHQKIVLKTRIGVSFLFVFWPFKTKYYKVINTRNILLI